MRCDQMCDDEILKEYVSIHTPTWGVTSNSMYCVIPPMFQSTHLHEVWPVFVARAIETLKFQSTHLHEVWHKDWLETVYTAGFNPHTYMRCDYTKRMSAEAAQVSIHTPTWGVTRRRTSSKCSRRFQSTHLHEVWPGEALDFMVLNSFNPHTYMRCDSTTCSTNYTPRVSIHTPTWGVTLFISYLLLSTMFQSTHLHEVWRYEHSHSDCWSVSIHTPTWGVTLL